VSYRDPFALNDALSAVRDHMERWDRLTRSSAIESALSASQEITRQIDTLTGRSLAAQVLEATASVQPVYEGFTAKMDMLTGRSLAAQVAETTAAVPRAYEDLTAKTDMLGDLTKPMDALGDQLTRTSALLPPAHELDQISSLNRMIRGSLAEIEWNRLHEAFHFGDELARMTAELTAAYQELAFQPHPSEALITLERLPAIELYAHATLLRSLGHSGAAAPAEAEEKELEESRIREEIDDGSRVTLQRLLAEHYPDLLDLWLGALEALSNRHDAVRKYCSSQRALLKRLLLNAAPNEAVKGWTNDQRYFSSRSRRAPTWRGRLAYLCDRALLKGYTHFVVTDTQAARAVWERLNQGEHEMPSSLTPRQLTDLQIRSNCLILMALMISIERPH